MTRQRAAHLVFVTAVAFSPDSKAMLTVSGDASARVTLAAQERSDLLQGFLILLILLAIVVMLILLLRHIDSGAMVRTEL
jgi:prolactin regulatory element-binding protein